MIRRMLRGALFLLPVWFLFPHLVDFAFLPGSLYSDMVISHFSNGLYLQRIIHDQHTIPLWSPLILSGYPFFANPLSGLYYLPGWLALAFPLPLGFNLVIVLHLLLGGIGMYLLLRGEGLEEGPALLGALAFEALPKTFSHLGAGHLTLLFAVAWTPWLLYAQQRVQRSQHPHRLKAILPGMVLGLVALADVRWAALAGLLWLTYSLRNWLNQESVGVRQRDVRPAFPWKSLGCWILTRISNILFAGLAAAPLLLPLAQYTRLSTRSLLTSREALFESLAPGSIIGLAYPNMGGPVEATIYPGVVVLLLAVYALAMPLVRRRVHFWLLVALVTLLYAMGSYIPWMETIVRLPGLNLLRVPARALFLTGFSLAVMAGYALQSLTWTVEGREWLSRDRSALAVFAVTLFIALLGLSAWFWTNEFMLLVKFSWGAIFILLAAGVIFLARARRASPALLMVLLTSLVLVDLMGVNALSLAFRSRETVLAEGQIPASYVMSQGGADSYRVYSPSYSLPQQTAAWYGIQQAEGVDPLQLKAYSDFMQRATGVPSPGYSVTIPPFPTSTTWSDNQSYLPDVALLGLLNVRFVISEFDIPSSGLRLLARSGYTRVYENLSALPRAWVQSADASPGKQIISNAVTYSRPNSILVNAGGPGLLVLSEQAYPGWQVRVDGRPAQLETVSGLLRGVRLETGPHAVEFTFRPASLYLGLILAAAAWLIFLLTLLPLKPGYSHDQSR